MHENESICMAAWLSKQENNVADISKTKMREKLEIWCIKYNILIGFPEPEENRERK